MTFTDRFVKPNYVAELSSVEGSISAVSSMRPQPAKVQVTGRVYTTAPLSISGVVQPFAKFLALDLKASAKGVDLPRFTTYSAKYVGYPIKRGKLSVDLEYKIKNRDLTASNHVVLNQLTFGDKTNSPDATKLPVLLAVALLKDSRGNIDINLPISGSLDDPQFSVGGIILRVLGNLLVKAVTSPFSLLASAFGSDEELSYVEFAPGSAALTPESLERIETLGKALADRPGLKMDISGRADPAADDAGLRQAWVVAQIRAAKPATSRRAARSPIRPRSRCRRPSAKSTSKRSTTTPTSKTSRAISSAWPSRFRPTRWRRCCAMRRRWATSSCASSPTRARRRCTKSCSGTRGWPSAYSSWRRS
ncbi:DUF748 domain-containing protein [Achromobacter sp. DMS1]|uniref:DUF748 domain-containing protein n=1 Tax=Achromobacter sp. DMS1 TaxID=1688405 RepID=UPI000B1EB0AC